MKLTSLKKNKKKFRYYSYKMYFKYNNNTFITYFVKIATIITNK